MGMLDQGAQLERRLSFHCGAVTATVGKGHREDGSEWKHGGCYPGDPFLLS